MNLLGSINIKYKDFEFRTVDRFLTSKGQLNTVELVKWNGDSCYTLLYWVKDDEGYYITFIGSRPMDDIVDKQDVIKIWEYIRIIQEFLDLQYN